MSAHDTSKKKKKKTLPTSVKKTHNSKFRKTSLNEYKQMITVLKRQNWDVCDKEPNTEMWGDINSHRGREGGREGDTRRECLTNFVGAGAGAGDGSWICQSPKEVEGSGRVCFTASRGW